MPVLGLDRLEVMLPQDRAGAAWGPGAKVYAPGSEASILNQHLAQKGTRGAIGPIVWNGPDIERVRQRAVELGHDFQYELTTADRHQLCLRPEKLYGYMAAFTQFIG